MNRASLLVGLALTGLALSALAPAHGQTLYATRDQYPSIADYDSYLRGNLQQLYYRQGGRRAAAYKLLETSLRQPLQDGDVRFALEIMGDYILGLGSPAAEKPDADIQEKLLELIVSAARDSDAPPSQRELATTQLARIADTTLSPKSDLVADSVKALTKLAGDDSRIVSAVALVGLGNVAARTGKDWANLADTAAKAIADPLDNSDPEMRRTAWIVALGTLEAAPHRNDATERMWKRVKNTLGDIKSPGLQREVVARLKTLIGARRGGVLAKEASATQSELNDLATAQNSVKGSLQELLNDLAGESNPIKYEAILARVEAEAKASRPALASVLTSLTSLFAARDASPYKVRRASASLRTLALDSESALVFYRSASILLGATALLRERPIAAIPLDELGSLLASTDQIVLLAPIHGEIQALAVSDLPFWLKRRLVSLLFVQAGDSINGAVRADALARLSWLGRDSQNWPLRMEVLVRMRQLAEVAPHAEVKSIAAQWK
ncbi:MAG: hypothetical protein HY423_04370 [Candidatus Lambdaproteobacteria bacterium]|nr:hypothetical protein [Candidatus Lambdaproteobacteria bacterium]